jgi:hypothetical protein
MYYWKAPYIQLLFVVIPKYEPVAMFALKVTTDHIGSLINHLSCIAVGWDFISMAPRWGVVTRITKATVVGEHWKRASSQVLMIVLSC